MATIDCPFCGVATELPHETQEACIEALRDEIARMHRILVQVTPAGEAVVFAHRGSGDDARPGDRHEPGK